MRKNMWVFFQMNGFYKIFKLICLQCFYVKKIRKRQKYININVTFYLHIFAN